MDREDSFDDEKIRINWEVKADADGVSLDFQCPDDRGCYGPDDRIGGELLFSEFADDDVYGFCTCLNFDEVCSCYVKKLEELISESVCGYMPGSDAWQEEQSYIESIETVKKELVSSQSFQIMWKKYKVKEIENLAQREILLRNIIMKFFSQKSSEDDFDDKKQDILGLYRHLDSLFNTDETMDREQIKEVPSLSFDDFAVAQKSISQLLERKRFGVELHEKDSSLMDKRQEIAKFEALERKLQKINIQRDSIFLLDPCDYTLIYTAVFEEEKKTVGILCKMLEQV